MIIKVGRDITGPVKERAEVCVIGTGSGGAVIAALLAEAGKDVVILEEGGYFTSRDFTGLEGEMYPKLYRDGAGQYTADGGVNVLQGRAVGGSTLINAADCTRIPPEVLAHWATVHDVEGVDEAALEGPYRRVETALGVNTILPGQINRNNAVLLEGAGKLAMKGAAFRNNRTGCQGLGICLIGCPLNAKKGAHLNYVPRAVLAGARLYADARADRLVVKHGAAAGVRGSILDRERGIATHPIEIEAERIVVAAGAIHTPLLLARSGLGGEQTGRNLTLQPQIPFIALFRDPVVAWKGIPQSVYVSEFDHNTPEHGLGGYRMEGISGGPAFGSLVFPGFGKAHRRLFERYPYTATALILVPDRPGDGFVSARKGGGAKISYTLQARWRANARKGLAAAARCYFEAGAEAVLWADEQAQVARSLAEAERAAAEAPLAVASARLVSAHCQGTCRMGEDPKTCVTDSRGNLHSARGFTICDASLFPSSAATHTMIPTMAMADLIAHHLIDAGV